MKRYLPRPTISMLLTILITVAFLIMSYDLWIIKNYTLQFNAKAANASEFQVFYTTRSSQIFSPEQTVTGKLTAGQQSVSITIPSKKLRRWRIDFLDHNNTITLSDFSIIGRKTFHLTDFSQLEYTNISNKKITAEGVSFTTAKNATASITDRQKLSLKSAAHLDWHIFVILGTIYFFLSYKVIKYLASFKLEGHYSRIDIVFLSLFFICLFLPMTNISQETQSNEENRVLAKLPSLKAIYDKEQNFGQQFEKWFNDRFAGRSKFIQIYDYLQRRLTNKGNDKVLIGDDGWLFFTLENSLENYKNTLLFTDEELQSIAQYLSDINQWAKANGKEFYYIICPDKNKIYGEYIKGIKKVHPDSQSRANQLINYLREHTDVTVIYPYEALHQAKSQGLLYWKNDTHWNKLGGYIGYNELIKAINHNRRYPFPVVRYTSVTTEKSPRGDLTKLFTALEDDNITDYPLPQITNTATCNHDAKVKLDSRCTNPRRQGKVTVFRDSFTTNMSPYLNNTFGDITYIWRYNIENSDIDDLKQSDIIILEQLERLIYHSVNLTFPKD